MEYFFMVQCAKTSERNYEKRKSDAMKFIHNSLIMEILKNYFTALRFLSALFFHL